MRRAGHNARAGFTLVEVMIAIAILAIVSSLVYGSFARTFEARDFVSRVQERYRTIRLALERMSREVSQAFIYDCREIDTPTGERRHRTLFKAEREGKVDQLTFSSFSHLRLVRDVNESDQNILSYFGQDDPEDSSKTNLMRREKTRIDGEPDKDGAEMVLCPDIESLRFEMWDDAKQEWVEEWDCSQVERLNQLPRLVRISLVVLDEQGQELPLATTARLFVTKPLATWLKPSQ